MKKKRKVVGICTLPQLIKSRKDAMKYQRLYVEQKIDCQFEKKRVKLERMERVLYSDLLEWIKYNIFSQELTTEELKVKIDEFQDLCQRQYEKYIVETNKLLEV